MAADDPVSDTIDRGTSYTIRRPGIYYLLLGSLGLLLMLAVVYFSTPNIKSLPFPSREFNFYQCAIPESQSKETFKVLFPTFIGAAAIADTLCNNTRIAQHFGAVKVQWLSRKEAIATAYLDSDNIQMAFGLRRYLLDELILTQPNIYKPIAELTPATHSGSFFWSYDAKLNLDADYLTGKKIGLLNDTNSQSLYKIPTTALNRVKLPEGSFHLQRFESLFEMQSALENGTVDLIAHNMDMSPERGGVVLRLGESEPSMVYIRSIQAKADMSCSILASLLQLFKTHNISDLLVIEPKLSCPEASDEL